MRAEVREEDLPPGGAEGAAARQPVLLDLPDGTTQTLTLHGVDGEPGKFQGLYKPVKTGPYKLYVEPGERFGADEVSARVFEVKLPKLELQEPRMDQDDLTRIAAASGGKFLRLDELSSLPQQFDELTEPILVGKTETELWDRPWVLLLFLGVIVTEWIGRKLSRML